MTTFTYTHPKFSPQRYRALTEVAAGRVCVWRERMPGYEPDVDRWLVDGIQVNPQSYNWLRAKSLIEPDKDTAGQQVRPAVITFRGRDALAREQQKVAARDPNSARAIAARKTAKSRGLPKE